MINKSGIKVLTVNSSDSQGGAARAAYRLHQSIQLIGLNAKMLVQKKFSNDFSVLHPESKLEKAVSLFKPFLDQLPTNIYKNKTKLQFSPAWLPFSRIVDNINSMNPDVVHLHWIASGMLRIEDLLRIKAPIIWSLHDMWAFTGGCHYDYYCGKYTLHCGKCPSLGSNKTKDLSYMVFRRKVKTYMKINNLTIVGLSRWMAESAKQSVILKDKPIVHIPNPINTKVFKPINRELSREILGISSKKKVVLFGAMSATTDPRKGYAELSNALNLLNNADIELAVFGPDNSVASPAFKFPISFLGRFHDDLSLAVLYSAADVMVVPSLQENLANVIMESLACGTPVVAFDIGGNSDLIGHKLHGYLAKPFDPNDLALGIKYVLEQSKPEILRNNAVKKVQECFEAEKVAIQYCQLYYEIINKGKS